LGRLRLKLAVVLAVCFQFPARSASAQTAAELIAEIEKQSGVAGRENTVDTFKAGDPSTRVRGIAVTMMATLDVLQRAAAQGLNLVITHEPTFYSHRDLTDGLRTEGDSIFAVKAKFIADHGLVVWRFHDRPHAMPPDMIRTGMLRALGWENRRSAASPLVVELEPASVESIARHVKSRLGAGAVRMIGDTSAVAKRVGFTQGFPGFAANKSAVQQSIDVLVMGEDHEWETIAYAADAITAGKLKAVIVLGHVPSEQAGMEEVTRWLKTFVTSVPVRFLPTRDPFVPLR
jgi:putative NIF3 family GTP cyclohydrolase 1 type 2